MKEYLTFHDPERWVDSDMQRDGYLMIAKQYAIGAVALMVFIYLIVRFW